MKEQKSADEIMEDISDIPEELEPLMETPEETDARLKREEALETDEPTEPIAEPTEDEVE